MNKADTAQSLRGERRPTPAEVERALASVQPDTRSLFARLMGDPRPGRSALDMAKAQGAGRVS